MLYKVLEEFNYMGNVKRPPGPVEMDEGEACNYPVELYDPEAYEAAKEKAKLEVDQAAVRAVEHYNLFERGADQPLMKTDGTLEETKPKKAPKKAEKPVEKKKGGRPKGSKNKPK